MNKEIEKLIATAETLGLSYGTACFTGSPRWEFRGSFFAGAEDFAEAAEWAEGVSDKNGDSHAAKKFRALAEKFRELGDPGDPGDDEVPACDRFDRFVRAVLELPEPARTARLTAALDSLWLWVDPEHEEDALAELEEDSGVSS